MKIKVIVTFVLASFFLSGCFTSDTSGDEGYIFASDIIKSVELYHQGEKFLYQKYQDGTSSDRGEMEQDINLFKKGLTNAILSIEPYLKHNLQPIRFMAQKINSSYQQGLNTFNLLSEQTMNNPEKLKPMDVQNYVKALNEIVNDLTTAVMALIKRDMLKEHHVKALKGQLVETFGDNIKMESKKKTSHSVGAARGIWWALTKGR